MWPFKKKGKKEGEEDAEESEEDAGEEEKEGEDKGDAPAPAQQAAPPTPEGQSVEVTVAKMTADVEKLKAQFTTFYELQKAGNERFSNMSGQIGELRSMMIERDKDGQRLEAKATQAVDMVKTVQPDKFLVDLRKMDSKIEALRANVSGSSRIRS